MALRRLHLVLQELERRGRRRQPIANALSQHLGIGRARVVEIVRPPARVATFTEAREGRHAVVDNAGSAAEEGSIVIEHVP